MNRDEVKNIILETYYNEIVRCKFEERENWLYQLNDYMSHEPDVKYYPDSFDMIDYIEFIMCIEKKFNIEFSDVAIDKLNSFEEFIDLTMQEIKGK